MPKKIVSIVGARPQFVKAAVVSRQIQLCEAVTEVMVHSGQHYDFELSNVFFEQLSLPPPEHHLAVGSGSHAQQTADILTACEEVLLAEKPDWVLVYGDTNTTLAGALAAAKLCIPVAHVESGLRSFNRAMPEEVNRIVTDSISDVLFAPTKTAFDQLRTEGQPESNIELVGDVMYDAALQFGELAQKSSKVIDELGIAGAEFVLSTIHRAENTDDLGRLGNIMQALADLSKSTIVVLPLHPRTKHAIARLNWPDERFGRIRFIPPASFLDMLQLEKSAQLIVTDSGGVQKEAYFHRVPCVTLRTETEWVELVEHGWNRLLDPRQPEVMARGLLQASANSGEDIQLYGNGDAAQKIVARLAG